MGEITVAALRTKLREVLAGVDRELRAINDERAAVEKRKKSLEQALELPDDVLQLLIADVADVVAPLPGAEEMPF